MINTSKTANSAVCLPDNLENFKQISVEKIGCLPNNKPPIKEVLNDSTTVDVVEQKIVDTPIGTALEGTILTGKSLIVCLEITQKFQYVSGEDDCTVHSYQFKFPCLVSLTLSKNYNQYLDVSVGTVIEDLFYELITPDSIYTNSTILVFAEQI